MKKKPGFHLCEAPLACQISIHSKKKPSKRTEILHCHRHESNWMITLKKCVESKVLPKEDKMLSHNKKKTSDFFFHFHTGIINNSPVVSI